MLEDAELLGLPLGPLEVLLLGLPLELAKPLLLIWLRVLVKHYKLAHR